MNPPTLPSPQVGDDYLEYLSELDKKLKFVTSNEVCCLCVGGAGLTLSRLGRGGA